MTGTHLGRLVWKEYRTQRGLWLGIAAIILVVQLMVWWLMPPNERAPLAALMSIGMILSTFYALGSAAVAFAGEREEGTAGWLGSLPVASLTVLVGKLAWLAASWASTVALALAAAWLLTRGRPGSVAFAEENWPQIIGYGALLPLWAIFCSLFCRRVHSAMALAAVLFVATMGIDSFLPGTLIGTLAALTAGNIALGRRWLHAEGEFAFDRIGRFVRPYTLSDALETSVESSPWWRSFRRELWLEWRHARWWAVGFALLAFGSILLIELIRYPDGAKIAWLLVFVVTPVSFGASVFRAEQFRQRFRFQANRGVTPAALWLSKHLVWLGLLFAVQLVLLLPMMSTIALAVGRWHGQFLLHELFPFPSDFLPEFLQLRMLESPLPFLEITAGFTLLMYALGQACSLLVPRAITSGALAVLGGALASLWMLAAVLLDVPLSIAVAVPCLLMGGFTLARMHGWLTERNTFRDRLKLTGAALLLTACVASSWGAFRLLELDSPRSLAGAIALFPPLAGSLWLVAAGFAQSPAGMILAFIAGVALLRRLWPAARKRLRGRAGQIVTVYGLLHLTLAGVFVAVWTKHNAHEIDARLAEAVPRWTPAAEAIWTGERYRAAEQILTEQNLPLPQEPDDERLNWNDQILFPSWDDVAAEQRQWLIDNQPSLAVLREATERESCAPENPFPTGDSRAWKTLYVNWLGGINLLRLSALQAEDEGRLKDAWSDHRAALRMAAHHTQSASPGDRYWTLHEFHRILLRHDLTRWMNRPGQAIELLDAAVRDLADVYAMIPSLESSLDLTAARVLWELDRDDARSWMAGTELSPENLHAAFCQWLDASPWERPRATHLVASNHQRLAEWSRSIELGDLRELAKWFLEMYSQHQHHLFVRYPVLMRYSGYPRPSDRDIEREEATPVYMVASADRVSDVMQNRIRYGSELVLRELDTIRARRLAFLRLAWTRHQLLTGEEPASLDALAKNPSAKPLLDAAAGLERNDLTNFAPDEQRSRYWRILQDPVNGSEVFDINELRSGLPR